MLLMVLFIPKITLKNLQLWVESCMHSVSRIRHFLWVSNPTHALRYAVIVRKAADRATFMRLDIYSSDVKPPLILMPLQLIATILNAPRWHRLAENSKAQ
ncbi:hypothetical protein BGV56_18725 [Burkholderia ubonensis]|nr:hypothetical protein BGV56_18725 [Burkholderia ubonensis]